MSRSAKVGDTVLIVASGRRATVVEVDRFGAEVRYWLAFRSRARYRHFEALIRHALTPPGGRPPDVDGPYSADQIELLLVAPGVSSTRGSAESARWSPSDPAVGPR